MEGWIRLHRRLLDSQVFANEKALKIWLWLILKARHNKGYVTMQIGKGSSIIELERGQLLFGRFKAEESLNIDGSTIYKWIHKFEEWEMIEIKSNSHSTIITICNYDIYNHIEDNEVTAVEQPSNNQVTAVEQPLNTNKNYKNYKNYKNKLMLEISETEIPNLTYHLKIAYNFWKLFRRITIEANSKPTIIDKAKTNDWENHVRLMIEKKEVTEDELRKIYKWLESRKTKGAQFWASNIKSTAKLREQIPKLLEKMASETNLNNQDEPVKIYPGSIKKRLGLKSIKEILNKN